MRVLLSFLISFSNLMVRFFAHLLFSFASTLGVQMKCKFCSHGSRFNLILHTFGVTDLSLCPVHVSVLMLPIEYFSYKNIAQTEQKY